ncbi:MAG: cytidine deaminase [Dehalococcoidia bacterium]|nr:cytidine deaminase [Dehalococcoidia bacterium]
MDAATRDRLMAAAVAAKQRAYCPYSRFPVGAAALTDDGTIAVGCNVENASYGLTICAERNAVAAAVVAGSRRLVAVAIATDAPTPTTPCGACRQTLHEFGPTMTVLSVSAAGEVAEWPLADLLPAAFGVAAPEDG